MARLISLLALAIVGSLQLPIKSLAADDPGTIGDIVERAVRPAMAEHEVPGMAVAVTVDGRPAFFNYGVASREDGSPISEHTLFEIGSVSKTFTGVLVSYAQMLGKLKLDDRPGRFLPQLEGSPVDEVSLLNLGTYTAGGLPLQFPDDVSDDARMIGYFRQWKPDAVPGTRRRYSNPSLGLLGHLTGIALDKDFAEAIENRLLPELRLEDTHIRVPETAMARYAWGYAKANKPIRVNPGMFDAETYGIKSTAADMIRFVQANVDPGGLEGPMRRAIEGTQVGYFRVGEMVQGLGWEQYSYPIGLERLLAGNSADMIMQANPVTAVALPQAPSGPTLFNKTGSTNGFGAYVAFVPERKIGVVMLANRNFPIPARIRAAHRILEQLASMPAPMPAPTASPAR